MDSLICRKCYGHSWLANIVIHCCLHCFPYSYFIFRSCELVITDYIGQSTKIPKSYCDDCHFGVWLEVRSLHVVLHNKLEFSETIMQVCGCPEQVLNSKFFMTFIPMFRLHISLSTAWNILWMGRLARHKCTQWGIMVSVAYFKEHLRHAFFNTVDSSISERSSPQCPECPSR